MKGTVFAVALNHQSQRDAWRDAFEKAPYNTPPKTAVWFIKPHNTVIRTGDPIPFPQGETVLSGATVALVVGIAAAWFGASLFQVSVACCAVVFVLELFLVH